jgi:4-hydroxy-tetrahydrodipicolinate reductase
MKIVLIGYGKMGQAIEQIASQKGHEIVLKIDLSNIAEFTKDNLAKADIAIEFTSPHTAFENVKKCLEYGIPVVCGSTGWLDRWNEIETLCTQQNGTLLYASNFSIGVNLFFELNTYLAKLMNKYNDYNISLTEIHHTQKKDAPSGTAITLAEQIITNNAAKNSWINEPTNNNQALEIISERIDPAPGTHTIKYSSIIDDIEITHTAHNRIGFASGAVLAAAFIANKKGIFTMKDVLGI